MNRNCPSKVSKLTVSVIIPTYNRSALLNEAILSVIRQTYRPIECIVVDDGSTDDTKAIIDKIKNEINEGFTIQYILQSNCGAQVARNVGTATACGEFIQYLDSDDLLYQDKLSKQVEYLYQHPSCNGIFGDSHIGTVNKHKLIKGYLSSDLIGQILTLEGCIPIFSILYRREIVNRIGNWDIKIRKCQEIDFQLRGLLEGAVFHYQPIITGLWRHHDGPRIMSKLVVRDLLFFYRKWEQILSPIEKFPQSTRDKIATWFMYFASQIKNENKSNIELLVSEAVRLNPNLPFYNSIKMKALRMLFGKKMAIAVWLYFYKRIKY